MRTSYQMAAFAAVGLLTMYLVACQTDEPGVKDTLGTYSRTVSVAPDKATSTAAKAMGDLKLLNINQSSTKVDGTATAMTAEQTPVNIHVEWAGENVSRITVRVGKMGDKDISMKILDRIDERLR